MATIERSDHAAVWRLAGVLRRSWLWAALAIGLTAALVAGLPGPQDGAPAARGGEPLAAGANEDWRGNSARLPLAK